MNADTNVRIVFIPRTEELPNDISSVDPTRVFYFPHCTVYREFKKDLNLIQLPTMTLGLDLYMCQDEIRVVGNWYDDHQTLLYDGRTVDERVRHLENLNVTGDYIGYFRWYSGSDVENLKVKVHTLNSDIPPGEGGAHTYNFQFMIIDWTVAPA